MSPEGASRLRRAVFQAAAGLLALCLFIPAAALLVSPAGIRAFRDSGLPDWVRWALATPEMVGAVLLTVPASFWWGAAILAADLGGAVAAHFYVHRAATLPWIWLGALLLLGAYRRTARAAARP